MAEDYWQEECLELRTRITELEGECAKAGIGEYSANYYLGELTTTGKLRAERDRYRGLLNECLSMEFLGMGDLEQRINTALEGQDG